ncbi:MAG: hypothetical protein IJY47_04895 [Clostridia bacterium]|nr:hypothetical protein [Clostridia bacterium]
MKLLSIILSFLMLLVGILGLTKRFIPDTETDVDCTVDASDNGTWNLLERVVDSESFSYSTRKRIAQGGRFRIHACPSDFPFTVGGGVEKLYADGTSETVSLFYHYADDISVPCYEKEFEIVPSDDVTYGGVSISGNYKEAVIWIYDSGEETESDQSNEATDSETEAIVYTWKLVEKLETPDVNGAMGLTEDIFSQETLDLIAEGGKFKVSGPVTMSDAFIKVSCNHNGQEKQLASIYASGDMTPIADSFEFYPAEGDTVSDVVCTVSGTEYVELYVWSAE